MSELEEAIAQFDIHDPKLPKITEQSAFSSGKYPHARKLKRSIYEEALLQLQIELVKLQTHLYESGERVVVLFEGRDAAGKGGAIKRYGAYLNPRSTRVAALPKPSDREQSQWYFQRYVAHLPAAGETVLFDRSWYNRAVVEPVMGFCTPEQTNHFMGEAVEFEHMLVREGIHIFKFWLNIGRTMQMVRFHSRRHDPLRQWKLSPTDIRALGKWADYSAARNRMLTETDSDHAPWTVVRANDKRRARLGIIHHVLDQMKYGDKNLPTLDDHLAQIVYRAPDFLRELADAE